MNRSLSKSLIFAVLSTHSFFGQTTNAPKNLFSSLKNSLATIVTLDSKGKPFSQGSGVLIENYIIVTNFHVIATGSQFEIVIGNNKFEPIAIRYRQDRDLAYLKFDVPIGPPVKRGNSNELNVGDKIYTIGSPLGLDQTLSDGLISAFRQEKGIRYIQTTAPISPGSSGGGLFDKNGKLIGITTFTMINGQNLNFAIPIEEVQPNSINNIQATRFPITINNDSDNEISKLATSISSKTISVSEPVFGGLSNGTIIMSICTNTRISFSKDFSNMFVRHTGDYSANLSGVVEYAPDQEIIIPLASVAFTTGSQRVPLGKNDIMYYNISAVSIDGSKCILSNTSDLQGSDNIVFIASKSRSGIEELRAMINLLKQKVQSN